MSAHTPGPWRWHWGVNEELHADCGVYSEKREGQAYSVCRAPRYESQAQWEANARLIAAAPELLEVAKDLLRHGVFHMQDCSFAEVGGYCDDEDCGGSKRRAAAQAVIAKAEGQS